MVKGSGPNCHNAFSHAVGEHRVDHARSWDEHAIPEHQLVVCRHECSQQQAVCERRDHADRVQVIGCDRLQCRGCGCEERSFAVAAAVSDCLVERAVEPLVRRRQHHDVSSRAKASRGSGEFPTVVLDMFEDVHVEDGVEAILARQGSDSSKRVPVPETPRG